jgi:HAD superfamily hydrolase (TIGR01549 family)
MPRAIIFDLDGTLYESRQFPLRLILSDPFHISYLGAERKCRKLLRDRYFDTAHEYYEALFSLMGKGSQKRSLKARDWFYKRYMPAQVRIIRKCFGPREGVKGMLQTLRGKGYKIALLSDYSYAREKLEAIGLSVSDFDAVWESPALGGLKPRREVFQNACAALGVQPAETLMVGDKASTDGGALAAGLRFIRIANSLERSERSRVEDLSRPGFARPMQTSTMLWIEFLHYADTLPDLAAQMASNF